MHQRKLAENTLIIVGLLAFFCAGFLIGSSQQTIANEDPEKIVWIDPVPYFDLDQFIQLFYTAIVECSICPDSETEKVVHVILNRQHDNRFPSTIDSVLLQRNAIQAAKKWDLQVYRQKAKVVYEAMRQPRDERILGYYRPDISTDTAHIRKVEPLILYREKYHVFHAL